MSLQKNDSNDLFKEFRCPKCYLIPFIQLYAKKNNLIMKIKCINNHEFTNSIKELENKIEEKSLNKIICNKCKVNIKKELEFFYCINCYENYCNECKNFHESKNKNHKLINIEMIDNNCFEHENNSCIGYCFNHNKNFCKDCSHYKEIDINLFEELNENEINNYQKNILNNENDINELNSSFEQLKKVFEKFENNFILFKQNVEKRILFIKQIIKFYKFKKIENKINFQMIENIKCNIFKIKNLKLIIQNQIQSQIQNFYEINSLLNKNEETLENK